MPCHGKTLMFFLRICLLGFYLVGKKDSQIKGSSIIFTYLFGCYKLRNKIQLSFSLIFLLPNKLQYYCCLWDMILIILLFHTTPFHFFSHFSSSQQILTQYLVLEKFEKKCEGKKIEKIKYKIK